MSGQPTIAASEHQSLRNLRNGVGLIAGLLILLVAGHAWLAWQAEWQRQVQQTSALTELGAKALDGYFATLEVALREVGERVRKAGGGVDVAAADIALKRLNAAHPELRIALVTRIDGQIVATTQTTHRKSLPTLASEPSFMRSREELSRGQRLSIGRPFLGPVSGGWVIPVRVGVHDAKDGRLLYLVGAGLPLENSQSLWREAQLAPGSALGVVHDDGFIVSRFPLPPDAKAESIYGQPQYGVLTEYLKREKNVMSGLVEGASNIAGTRVLFAFRRLPHDAVTFYVVNPVANVWLGWWTQMRFSFVLIAVSLLLLLVIYRWVRERQLAWECERVLRIRELEIANRDLESFSYSVSHDLRAPVRAISGFGSMLHEDQSLSPGARQLLGRITAAAKRMSDMIEDMLRLASISRRPVEFRRLDLSALVGEILGRLREVQPARRVETAIAPALFAIADAGLMRIALENLLGNAWKFTAGRDPARIEFGAQTENAEVRYYLRDNGAGFDMQHAKKLFLPFQRLHSSEEFEGTGVGLATVRRILDLHGGSIQIDSTPAAGTTVYFTLGDGQGREPAAQPVIARHL